MTKVGHTSERNATTNTSATDRTTAKIVGALIITGYVTYGVPEGTLIQPLLNAPDPLASVSAGSMQLTIGALIMAVNSAAVVGIGVFLYPVLKRHSDSIAIGYLGTRLFESVVMVGGLISLLLLVPLSQAYVQASAADAATLDVLGTLAVQGNVLAYQLAMIGLSIGSLPFCYLLYRSKLVPRGISVLGLIGYPLLVTKMLIEMFGVGSGPILSALYVPGGLFEIGFALWIIVRGFDFSPNRSGTSKMDTTEL